MNYWNAPWMSQKNARGIDPFDFSIRDFTWVYALCTLAGKPVPPQPTSADPTPTKAQVDAALRSIEQATEREEER